MRRWIDALEMPPTAGLPLRFGDLRAGSAASLAQTVAPWTGTPDTITTCSGTAALVVALRCLAAQQDDRREVIVPAYTCPLVALAVAHCGLRLRLCDTLPGHFAMDPGALRALLGPQTLAVVPADLGGLAGIHGRRARPGARMRRLRHRGCRPGTGRPPRRRHARRHGGRYRRLQPRRRQGTEHLRRRPAGRTRPGPASGPARCRAMHAAVRARMGTAAQPGAARLLAALYRPRGLPLAYGRTVASRAAPRRPDRRRRRPFPDADSAASSRSAGARASPHARPRACPISCGERAHRRHNACRASPRYPACACSRRRAARRAPGPSSCFAVPGRHCARPSWTPCGPAASVSASYSSTR